MQFSEQRHKKHTFETCKNYYLSFEESKNLLYAIIDKKTGVHVGNINAYIDPHNGTADIGILVGKGGKGYGYKAWIQMIKILFQEKNIRKITAGTMFNNTPMLEIFKKSGMTHEYTKIDQFICDGKPIHLIGYCIFKEEYQ